MMLLTQRGILGYLACLMSEYQGQKDEDFSNFDRVYCNLTLSNHILDRTCI